MYRPKETSNTGTANLALALHRESDKEVRKVALCRAKASA